MNQFVVWRFLLYAGSLFSKLSKVNISSRSSKIQRLNIVGDLIKMLMPIAAEDEPQDADEDNPTRLALSALHSLGMHLPPQHVFPTLIQIILQYMTNTDHKYRKAAMLGFAVTDLCLWLGFD